MATIKLAIGSLSAFNALPAEVQATFSGRYNTLWALVNYLHGVVPLTSDYEAVIIESITETTWGSWTDSQIAGNGKYLDIYPYNSAYTITINCDPYFGNVLNYEFDLRLHGCTIQCPSTGVGHLLGFTPYTGGYCYGYIYNNIFKGISPADTVRTGLKISSDYMNRCRLRSFNNRFYNLAQAIWCARNGVAATSYAIFENTSIENCDDGLYLNKPDAGVYIRNVAVRNCSNNCYFVVDTGTPTLLNNADDDDTFPAHSGEVRDITAGDFISVDIASSNFLKINTSSKLYATGTTTISAYNTSDIDGRPRPDVNGKVSIGASEPYLGMRVDTDLRLAFVNSPIDFNLNYR